jgi:Phage Terminase
MAARRPLNLMEGSMPGHSDPVMVIAYSCWLSISSSSDHPVLNMCANNTVIVLDDAGNRKPSKKRSVGRIDGIVALAMAIGVAPLKPVVIDVRALIG